MLALTIKPILELVPEATSFVKKASLDMSLPLDNRDSCIATALELKYHEVVDHKPVDVFSIEKVATAIKLYNVEDTVRDLSNKLIKAANQSVVDSFQDKSSEYLTKQACFEGDLCGMSPSLVDLSKKAVSLHKQASELGVEPSDTIKRYSGHGYLDKKAAIESLAARYQASSNTNFVKIAQALYKTDMLNMKPESVVDICTTICSMDKEAGLSSKGFNFFKETVITKSAASALQVTLCNKSYPYESIQRLGTGRIAQFLGKDIADELEEGPMNAKQVLETLPRDLQQVLCNLLKNV